MKTTLSLFLLCFSVLAQVPTPRPEPAATSYDTSELNLLPSYNRSTFKAATGKDAPEFDITKAPKTWFDSTVGSDCAKQVIYKSLIQFALVPFSIPACEAARVNIPPDSQPQLPAALSVVDDGVRYTSWPDLDVELQLKTQMIESFTDCPYDPNKPCSAAQPIVLADKLAEIQAQADYVCKTEVFNDRVFHGGVDPACNAPALGKLAVQKYQELVTDWVAVAQKVQDLMGLLPGTPCKFCSAIAKTPVPMPARDLYPDEQVRVASMMGGVLITRAAAPTPVQVQGGTFTDSDRAMLKAIYDALKPIMLGQ